MAPELVKFRLPALAKLLNRIANVWLGMTAAAVLVYLLVEMFRAETLAAGLENILRLCTPAACLLVLIALTPAIGLKVWARRVLGKRHRGTKHGGS